MIATLFAMLGRLLLAFMFIIEGGAILLQSAVAQGVFADAGLPTEFAVPAGIVMLLLGLMLALGAWTRTVAVLLIAILVLQTLFFYRAFTDGDQAAMALRNLAVMGGLFSLIAYGQAKWGIDAVRASRRRERLERDDQLRQARDDTSRAQAERDAAVRDSMAGRPSI